MRISNNMIYNSLLNDINKNRQSLADIQNKVASGKRVEVPSDDSTAYAKAASIDEVIQKNEQYKQNIGEGLKQARQTQYSLDKMLDQLNTVKQHTVQGANGSANTDNDLEILADNVAAAKENIMEQGNSRSAGRFLFGGTQTQNQPFEMSGGSVGYNGNSEELTIQVSDTAKVNVGVDGSQLQDVFNTLDQVESALRSGDREQVRQLIDQVDARVEDVSSISSKVAQGIDKMEYLEKNYEDTNVNNQTQKSRLVDTDYAQALSDLQKYQTSYQAALSANSRIVQTSLVNLLG